MMNPARSRLKYKKTFPIFYWWYTFDEKQICVKKMNGRIMIETNDRRKITGYKTL
jgi:hypothetical protein